MTPEMEALGRRAVAKLEGNWRPGMAVQISLLSFGGLRFRHTGRLVDDDRRPGCIDWCGNQQRIPAGIDGLSWNNCDPVPDFGDPPTRGALLELVREAWGDPQMTTHVNNSGWGVVQGFVGGYDYAVRDLSSEAEALVAALEAAP